MHVKKIRAARREDLAQVIEIDALITGLRKPALVKLVDDLDSGVSAQVARDRAVLSIIDERRVSADALIRASELGPQSSPRAMQHVGSVLRRDLPDELQTAFRPLIEVRR